MLLTLYPLCSLSICYIIAGKRKSCLAHSCWLQIKKPVCMSAANAHGIWSGRRRGHLSACHLLAARKCVWYHGLDGDEDTCLQFTCRQQGNVHGIVARHLETDSPGHKTDLNILVPTLFHGHSMFTTHTDSPYKYRACHCTHVS